MIRGMKKYIFLILSLIILPVFFASETNARLDSGGGAPCNSCFTSGSNHYDCYNFIKSEDSSKIAAKLTDGSKIIFTKPSTQPYDYVLYKSPVRQIRDEGTFYSFWEEIKLGPDYAYFVVKKKVGSTTTMKCQASVIILDSSYDKTDPMEDADPDATPTSTETDNKGDVTPFQPNITIDHDPLTAPSWETVFGKAKCDSYKCWIGLTWNWAMLILVPLSVLILSAAGVIYVLSEGDSDRIGLAKKMILGVVSGLGLLVLSRVLLAIIGVEDKAWNITLNIVRDIWLA